MKPMRGFRVARLLLVSSWLVCLSQVAHAQDSSLAQAREYFQAGAQAYALGEYSTAIQAFEQAYQLVPRPAVLFSMAQAERKQYFLDHKPDHLRRAIELYKQYLGEEPQAGRKSDAVQALSELEPLAAIKEPPQKSEVSPEPSAAQLEQAPTRVMITAQATDAMLALDDQPAFPSPLIREIEPGEHVIRATATGYEDAERKLMAVKGALVTVDIVQAELPAKLVVNAREGAVLSIDGRVQGACPFPKPIELPAGSHLITLTLSGYVGLSREEMLARGHTTVINALMPRTVQRTTSLIMLGAAASAVTAGGIFGYLALQQDGSARDFLNLRGQQELHQSDLDQYNSSRQDRNRLRTASFVSFGVGAGLAVGGVLLIALDHDSLATPADSARRPVAKASEAPRLTAQPVIGPGFTGFEAKFTF